jgi:hypothetical protein
MSFFIGILSIDLFYLFTVLSSSFEALFVLLIMMQVIRINSNLKDKNLRIFIYSLLVLIIVISFSSIILTFSSSLYFEFYGIVSISYIIIFGIFFYTAWYNLEKFFDKNRNLFPNAVAQEAVRAIKDFKKATVLFILIIPAFLGILLYVRGCLMLGDALKKL